MAGFSKKGLEGYLGNPDVEREGVWFPLGNDKEPSFKLAYANVVNPDYQKAFEAAARPYRKLLAIDPAGTAKYGDKIMREVFAQAVCKDWKNVRDENEKEIPCTYENRIAYFEAFPRIFNRLVEVAKEGDFFSDMNIANESTDKGN